MSVRRSDLRHAEASLKASKSHYRSLGTQTGGLLLFTILQDPRHQAYPCGSLRRYICATDSTAILDMLNHIRIGFKLSIAPVALNVAVQVDCLVLLNTLAY